MRTEYFVTQTNLSTNDGNTFGPYQKKQECLEFIRKHNKIVFKTPKVIFVTDDKIIYKENLLKLQYEIFSKNIA